MCITVQGVKDKEVIAAELAAAEAHLSNTAFGQMLLRRRVSLAPALHMDDTQNRLMPASRSSCLRPKLHSIIGDFVHA